MQAVICGSRLRWHLGLAVGFIPLLVTVVMAERLVADGTVASEQKIFDAQGNFGGVLDDDFFDNSIANIGDKEGWHS